MLRKYVHATKDTDDETPPLKGVLWMYLPDYEKNGAIRSIKNVTNSRTEHAQTWLDFDIIRTIDE